MDTREPPKADRGRLDRLTPSTVTGRLRKWPTTFLAMTPNLKSPRFSSAETAFSDACYEFIKGCSCAPRNRPQDCPECTEAFLEAVLDRARMFNLAIGVNGID